MKFSPPIGPTIFKNLAGKIKHQKTKYLESTKGFLYSLSLFQALSSCSDHLGELGYSSWMCIWIPLAPKDLCPFTLPVLFVFWWPS